MEHENLNVVLDYGKIRELLDKEVIHLRERKDKNGKVHKELTLFVKVRKAESEYATHNVSVKEDGAWKDLRNKEGNIVFVGTAKPSKYQPDEHGDYVSQDPRTQQPDDIF